MSGASTPSNGAQAFTSEVSVAVPHVQTIGNLVTMPVPANSDLTLYDMLLVNHGPFAVHVCGAQAADGTMTPLPNGPWIAAGTSQVMPAGIISTATALMLKGGVGDTSVEVHRGNVASAPQFPTFTITG